MANTKKTDKTIGELIASSDLAPELKTQFEQAAAASDAAHEKAIEDALKAQSDKLTADHEKAKETALADQAEKFAKEHSDALEELSATHQSETEEIRKELEELKAKYGQVTKEIPGEYKSKSGSIYKFADGTFKFILAGQTHDSSEALKDADIMEELIDMGVGFLIKV